MQLQKQVADKQLRETVSLPVGLMQQRFERLDVLFEERPSPEHAKRVSTALRQLARTINRAESLFRKHVRQTGTGRRQQLKKPLPIRSLEAPPPVGELAPEGGRFKERLNRSVSYWLPAWLAVRTEQVAVHQVMQAVKRILDVAADLHNQRIRKKEIFGAKVKRPTVRIDARQGREWLDYVHRLAKQVCKEVRAAKRAEERRRAA